MNLFSLGKIWVIYLTACNGKMREDIFQNDNNLMNCISSNWYNNFFWFALSASMSLLAGLLGCNIDWLNFLVQHDIVHLRKRNQGHWQYTYTVLCKLLFWKFSDIRLFSRPLQSSQIGNFKSHHVFLCQNVLWIILSRQDIVD